MNEADNNVTDPVSSGGATDNVDEDGMTPKEREQHSLTSAAFDALEKDFREVLNEVVGGKSLEKFRQEYEKLHLTLKKSHDNEKRLIKKCRELNSEIVANAAKIQTALRLSVQDQNSITLLKKELDKAWKMVDGAQEKEKRARETIQRLKVEIQNLSRLVDQGAGLSIGQENAVNELLKIKDDLTAEIKMHTASISAQEVKIKQLITENNQLISRIRVLDEDNAKLTDEAAQMKENVSREKKRAERFKTEMLSIKKVNDKRKEDIKREKEINLALTDRVNSLNEELRKTIVEKDAIHQDHIELKEKMRDVETEKDEMTKKWHDERERKEQAEAQLVARRQELREANKRISTLGAGIQKLETEKEQITEKKVQAEKYKNWLKEQMKSVLKTVDAQKKDAETDEKIVKELQIQLKRLTASLHDANQKNQDQYKLVEENEHIKRGLEEDIIMHKIEEQQLRKRNYLLEKQKEKAAMQSANWQFKYGETLEQVKLKEMEAAELTKQIIDEKNKLRVQQNLYEQVRSDKNMYSQQQMQQKDDIVEMKRKFKIMTHQIEQLKEEIQNKDNTLINEHFSYKRLQAQMKVATRKLAKRREVLETADKVLLAQDAEIKNLRRMLNEAEVTQLQQKRSYDDLMQERDILGTQLIRRNDELALLYEKIRIQQSTLSKGETQYRERLQDLRALKIAINHLKQELQIRSQEVTNIDALKNEIYHVQRELLQERTKVKALSEELENPMNVHRWRKLEGSDPKRYELIQKIQTLQKRLISKTEEVVGKDILLEEKEKLYTELKNLLARQPGPEVAEQLSVYQHSLKEKTRQMKAMAAELNMFQAQSNEYRYEIDKIAKENQDVKRKFYEQRRTIQVQESKDRAKTIEKDPLFQQQKQFYSNQAKVAGGGYNLSKQTPK